MLLFALLDRVDQHALKRKCSTRHLVCNENHLTKCTLSKDVKGGDIREMIKVDRVVVNVLKGVAVTREGKRFIFSVEMEITRELHSKKKNAQSI